MPQIQRPPAFSGLVIYVFHLGSALDDSCSLRVALHFSNNDPKLQPTVAWESEAEVFLEVHAGCGVGAPFWPVAVFYVLCGVLVVIVLTD